MTVDCKCKYVWKKVFVITHVVIVLGEVIGKYGTSPISMSNCLFMFLHIECNFFCFVLFTWK